jgi:hypothetical protein
VQIGNSARDSRKLLGHLRDELGLAPFVLFQARSARCQLFITV